MTNPQTTSTYISQKLTPDEFGLLVSINRHYGISGPSENEAIELAKEGFILMQMNCKEEDGIGRMLCVYKRINILALNPRFQLKPPTKSTFAGIGGRIVF